jgi:hypothetical protein
MYWPEICTDGALPDAFRWRIEVTPLGAWGAHLIHVSITSEADDHGNDAKKYDADGGIGRVRSLSWVTTPKLPPPPPLSAHSRDGLLCRST